jgi:ATP-dependent RNA helicase DDX59
LVPSILKRKHPEKWNTLHVKKQKTQQEEAKHEQQPNETVNSVQQPTDLVASEPQQEQIKVNEPKLFSSLQRIAHANEPVCIICGKYGEYINDDTDHDICRYI